MKFVVSLGLITASLIMLNTANAATTKKNGKASPQNLSTDISFSDSTLHGHYQTPDEATARVENEKALADLLAVRTNFKDRLKKSSEQN